MECQMVSIWGSNCFSPWILVKCHPFFNDIDWDAILRKQVDPPYKPSMREINFSKEFTSIPITVNFEEEITRIERKMSGPAPSPDQTRKASIFRPNENFGELASKIINDTHSDGGGSPFQKRVTKPSEEFRYGEMGWELVCSLRPSLQKTDEPSAFSDYVSPKIGEPEQRSKSDNVKGIRPKKSNWDTRFDHF